MPTRGLEMSFIVSCEYCGQEKKQGGTPPRIALRVPNQPPQMFTVCTDCERNIKKLNEPIERAEREADERQAAETRKRLAEKEAAEKAEADKAAPVGLDVLANALTAIAQSQQQILEMLANKDTNVKTAKPNRRRSR